MSHKRTIMERILTNLTPCMAAFSQNYGCCEKGTTSCLPLNELKRLKPDVSCEGEDDQECRRKIVRNLVNGPSGDSKPVKDEELVVKKLTKIDKSLVKKHYKPKLKGDPKKERWDNELEDAMNTILKSLEGHTDKIDFRFGGVLTPSEFKKSEVDAFLDGSRGEIYAFVLNTTEKGEHWVSLVFQRDNLGNPEVLFFDSLASQRNFKIFENVVLDYATSLGMKLHTAKIKHQTDSSSVCGIYAVYFVTMAAAGRAHHILKQTRRITENEIEQQAPLFWRISKKYRIQASPMMPIVFSKR